MWNRLCIAGIVLVVSAGAGAAADLYELNAGSRFEDGCHDPCTCPLLIGPMRGTFLLTLVAQDPLFDTYEMSDIDWTLTNFNLHLTGSGEYRIGGEVALVQTMRLELRDDNGRDYSLTSHDPRITTVFPRISISADDQVDNSCVYSLAFVDATPSCPADFNGDGGVDGADVQAFYEAWQGGESRADVNHDGGVDGADVEYFFRRWEAGGCR